MNTNDVNQVGCLGDDHLRCKTISFDLKQATSSRSPTLVRNQLTKGSCHMALINGLEEKEKRERFS